MNIETAAPRVGNPSDAIDLINTLMGLVKDDISKKGLQLWCGLEELKNAIERGVI
jgi:hypothetical protein